MARYIAPGGKNTYDNLTVTGTLTATGAVVHTGSTFKFFNRSPSGLAGGNFSRQLLNTSTVLTNYTSDPESTPYTGALDGEAKLADLNALRVAYENLRTHHENTMACLNSVMERLQGIGIMG